MRLILLLFICFFLQHSKVLSQTEYIDINSSILKESRQIKPQLPRNYNSTEKEYPILLVLDGDYLFEPFAGNVDYLSYWGITPEAIPKALNSIFESYGPISDLEYQSKLLTSSSPSNYLEDRYFTIQELYALEIPIRSVDFLKTADAIEEKELRDDYQNLSKLAKKEASGTVLHHYFQGRYFEKSGQPKRAIKDYQASNGLESAGYLNSDVLLGKADALVQTFGY